MKPRIVLDTNILVSAALDQQKDVTPPGRPSYCVRLVFRESVHLILSEILFAEYSDVLSRPHFQFTRGYVQKFLHTLRRSAQFVRPSKIDPEVVFDLSDAPVLGTAVAGQADFLVTGNRKHFPRSYKGVVVMTPAEMVDWATVGKLL